MLALPFPRCNDGSATRLKTRRQSDARLNLCGVAWLLLVAAVVGCSSQAPPLAEPQVEQLAVLSAAYRDAKLKLSRPPRNLGELKQTLPAGANADEVLRSPRDGEPYVILFGVDPAAPIESEQIPLIAYEKQGSGGTRFALTVMGITELTDEEFAAYHIPASAE